jgi:hypothetical protein
LSVDSRGLHELLLQRLAEESDLALFGDWLTKKSNLVEGFLELGDVLVLGVFASKTCECGALNHLVGGVGPRQVVGLPAELQLQSEQSQSAISRLLEFLDV